MWRFRQGEDKKKSLAYNNMKTLLCLHITENKNSILFHCLRFQTFSMKRDNVQQTMWLLVISNKKLQYLVNSQAQYSQWTTHTTVYRLDFYLTNLRLRSGSHTDTKPFWWGIYHALYLKILNIHDCRRDTVPHVNIATKIMDILQ